MALGAVVIVAAFRPPAPRDRAPAPVPRRLDCRAWRTPGHSPPPSRSSAWWAASCCLAAALERTAPPSASRGSGRAGSSRSRPARCGSSARSRPTSWRSCRRSRACPASTSGRASARGRATTRARSSPRSGAVGFRLRDATGSIRVFPREARWDAPLRFDAASDWSGDDPPGLDINAGAAHRPVVEDREAQIAALLTVRPAADLPGEALERRAEPLLDNPGGQRARLHRRAPSRLRGATPGARRHDHDRRVGAAVRRPRRPGGRRPLRPDAWPSTTRRWR